MKDMNLTLAEQDGLGCVRVCECGSLNLNIGLVTIHLDPEAFLKTAALLRQAAEQYLKGNEPAVASSLTLALNPHSSRFTN
jgi:hypothetical protein